MAPRPGSRTERQPLPPETMDLIRLGSSGDRRAIELLIGRYQIRVARFVISETGERDHYEDLCQAIFVKMVVALPRLRDPERFEPWLFQIARNACRDHMRSRTGWRRLFVSFEPAHECIPTPDPPSVPDSEGRMEGGLAQLPAEQRNLLELRLREQTSYEDLARLSKTSVGAVKSRLYRARENLRGILLTEEPK